LLGVLVGLESIFSLENSHVSIGVILLRLSEAVNNTWDCWVLTLGWFTPKEVLSVLNE